MDSIGMNWKSSNSRVLVIIDDDRDFTDSLLALLRSREIVVEIAVDLAEAVEALEHFYADVALIDCRLGDDHASSGIDMIAVLRQRQPSLVCIMLSQLTVYDFAVDALRAGADDVLVKPIDPLLLFSTLERCIAKRRQQRESEQRFHDFTDAASDWFWETDENLRFIYFSDRWGDISGLPQDALIGKTRAESPVPGADPVAWKAHLDVLEAHRSYRDFIITRTRPDGSVVYMSTNGKAVFNEAGIFLGYRGVGKDISESKRSEKALLEAYDDLERRVEERTNELVKINARLLREIADKDQVEAKLREIFDESPLGIWESDWSAVKHFVDDLEKRGVSDWCGYFADDPTRLDEAYDLIKLVHVSRAVRKIYGVADITILANMFRAGVVAEDHIDGFRESLLSFIEGRMTSSYVARESRVVGANLVTRNILIVPSNYADDWSRVIYSVEDITRRTRAEEALKISEKRFRQLLESAPDAKVIVNLQGEIVLINQQTETLFGYSRDELIGRNVEILVPLDLREIHVRSRTAFSAHPQIRAMGKKGDLHGVARDGRLFPVEVSLSPAETDSGVLISATIRDITEKN